MMDQLDTIEGQVHTFIQHGPILMGADWSEHDVLTAIAEHGIEEAGPAAKAMGHGLVINRPQGPLFIASKPAGP